MTGVPTDPDLKGVIPNAFEHIFDHVATSSGPNIQFLVRASFLEIYNEEIRDLLSKDPKRKLDLKEHPDTGVYVQVRVCSQLRTHSSSHCCSFVRLFP